jgi:hydrogenase maturation protease
MTDPVRQIADAVLYEGYILWPYRRSATKNQQRWTFGGVYPPAHTREHPDDPCTLQAQCVLEGSDDVEVRVRFLQVVERALVNERGERVDELDGHLAWDEATEREVGTGPFTIPAGADEEPVAGGKIVRSWRELRGRVDVAIEDGLVTVRVENTTPWSGADRQDALRQTFCSTHAVLRTRHGAFVSATESECESVGLWPVLVGEPGARDTMLAAPIILPDYPQIAPESPGDLFDGTEIDKLLVLNVLALTPEEQAEMRATDPRAREILDRCGALSSEDLMRLHGAFRELR